MERKTRAVRAAEGEGQGGRMDGKGEREAFQRKRERERANRRRSRQISAITAG